MLSMIYLNIVFSPENKLFSFLPAQLYKTIAEYKRLQFMVILNESKHFSAKFGIIFFNCRIMFLAI